MIVRISRSGKSFKGLGTYLLHDPKAATSARVAWTHTLNLANDLAPAAIAEMIQTVRNAEFLKQEAGIRAGGRRTQVSVKHVSLNWPVGEAPTREQMIAATKSFLAHMGWGEHQTLIVAHRDRHSHLHLMINAVHAVRGLRLEDSMERRRAQVWALGYEQQQGTILCGNRLKARLDRQKSPPRDAWLTFEGKRRAFEQLDGLRRNEVPHVEGAKAGKNAKAREWRLLKDIQRVEREAFFTAGKMEFSTLRLRVYRELREEFRPQWQAYYASKKVGAETEQLKIMKEELVSRQRAALERRRDKACRELRGARDRSYRELLDSQADMRRTLRERQDAGLDSSEWLARLTTRKPSSTIRMWPSENGGTSETASGIRGRVTGGATSAWKKGIRSAIADQWSPTAHLHSKAGGGVFRLLSTVPERIIPPSKHGIKDAITSGGSGPVPGEFRKMASGLPGPELSAREQDSLPARRLSQIDPLTEEIGYARSDDADAPGDYGAAIDGILDLYQRKMVALRHSLPPNRLAAAIAALIEERRAAISALRGKRAWMRHGKMPPKRKKEP